MQGKETEDSVLWNAIASIGIRTSKLVSKKLKYISWLGSTFTCVCALQMAFLSFFHYYICTFDEQPEEGKRVSFAFALILFIPILTWLSLFRKINSIQLLLAQAFRFRNILHVLPDRGIYVTNIFIVLNCVILILLTIVNVIFINMSPWNEDCIWYFGFEITNPVLSNLLLITGNFSNYLFFSYTPVLINLVVCHVEYRFSTILIVYDQRLRNLGLVEDRNDYIDLFISYFQIIKILRKLKSVFSSLLFLLLSFNFVSVFILLSSFVVYPRMSYAARIQSSSIGFESCCMIIAQVYYGSLIPERLRNIQVTSGALIEKLRLNHVSHTEMLFLLERIEKNEIIYLTVGGLVNVKPSLLLTACGSLLTYGLLIINLK